MGIKLGIPVVDGYDLTKECIHHLDQNSTIPESVEILIIDNESVIPYTSPIQANKIRVNLVRNNQNQGYYWPLTQVAENTTNADIVGLMHNDLFIYEYGWDRKLLDSFINHSQIGMIGVCGSDEVDDRGGRGGGTMCNFTGRVGQLQEHTGKRIRDLQPALILDSMLMAMRRPVVDILNIDKHIAPCHFYDKIWPLQTIQAGWKVGVLGLEVDHQGGLTTTGSVFEGFCEIWCREENIPFEPGKANLAVYLEAERRFLTYGKSINKIPSKIK